MTMLAKKSLYLFPMIILVLVILVVPATALNLDTDIYAISSRPNVAILFDTSGSMGSGVYENGVNYKNVYASACIQTDGGYTAYDKNDKNHSGGGTNNPYFHKFIEAGGEFADLDPDEIVLIRGSPGVNIVNGISMVGDTGDHTLFWYFDNIIRTGMKLVDGELVPVAPAITNSRYQLSVVGADKTIYLGGVPLPLDRGINLNDPETLEDNTVIDHGFAGLMEAPGLYFTGYNSIPNDDDGIVAGDGDYEIYFLATVNRVHMMLAYNLFTAYYDSGLGGWDYSEARSYQVLSNYTITLLSTAEEDPLNWTEVSLGEAITSSNYPDDYDDPSSWGWGYNREVIGSINQLNATQIKLHFTDLELDCTDRIEIRNLEDGTVLSSIDCSMNRTTPFYTAAYTVSGAQRGLTIVFITKKRMWPSVAKGFKIDKYQYTTPTAANDGTYKMQTRIDAVRTAIKAVVDDTLGDINWSISKFSWPGASVSVHFPDQNTTDEQMKSNINSALDSYSPDGGTPLGGALQDTFNLFHDDSNDNQKDISSCSKQFCILISDGYPSAETSWSRMDSNVTISDFDEDGWKSDPSQDTVKDCYLDDVAHYMYTHSFRGSPYSQIEEPETSFDNITVHTLSFALDIPILTDTAEGEGGDKGGGGKALVAKSSQQVANAIRSLAIMTIKSASYVAPVISVDTANKTQSGEWLYMAFFKPTSERWVGNLKKYKLVNKVKLGNCPDRTKEEWVVTDAFGDNSDALDCDGQFKAESKSYWSTIVDRDEVTKGGVGERLYNSVKTSFEQGTYYAGRDIYVLKNENEADTFPAPVALKNISNSDLGAADDLERYKIINYVYGYTYSADENTHAPETYRNWPLGSFIHSNPNLITYENVTGDKTYIIIGSNDGMIHVFDDESGNEVVAFIPEDVLPLLKKMNPDKAVTGYKDSPLSYIDGQTSYYQTFSDEGKSIPKQLIFGLRRGGTSYYSLNVENSDPRQWTLKWHINSNSGNFSEMGQSWSKIELMPIRTGSGETVAGVFGGGYDPVYDDKGTLENSDSNKPGAALYVIDILNSNAAGISLLKKVAYNLHDGAETDNMHYAIPANPAVVPDKYGRLQTIYFSDLGGQVWNLGYDTTNFTFDLKPRLVFQANPGSDAGSGNKEGFALNTSDTGRRMFYSPSITLMGGCNYRHSETCDYTDLDDTDGAGRETCNWLTRDPKTYALVVGTGDRVHPNRKDINNRIYMILDTNEDEPLNETNLFNVTMDEIDIDSVNHDTNHTAISEEDKTSKRNYLSTTNGWYIKLEDIDDLDDYGEPVHHDGEKILAHPVIFNNVAYVPSFTPISDDKCHPKGEAKVYALHYCDGTAGVNFYKGNDTSGDNPVDKFDYRDRYRTIGESLPSDPKVIIRKGKAEIFISVGGGLPTIESGLDLKPIEIINWRELRN